MVGLGAGRFAASDDVGVIGKRSDNMVEKITVNDGVVRSVVRN